MVNTCPSTCQHLAAPGRSCGSIRPYALSSNPHATTLASCRNPRGPVDRSALAQPSTTLVQPSHKLDYCTPEFLAKPARPQARKLNPDDDRRVRCRDAALPAIPRREGANVLAWSCSGAEGEAARVLACLGMWSLATPSTARRPRHARHAVAHGRGVCSSRLAMTDMKARLALTLALPSPAGQRSPSTVSRYLRTTALGRNRHSGKVRRQHAAWLRSGPSTRSQLALPPLHVLTRRLHQRALSSPYNYRTEHRAIPSLNVAASQMGCASPDNSEL